MDFKLPRLKLGKVKRISRIDYILSAPVRGLPGRLVQAF
jgi:hypothetical protein